MGHPVKVLFVCLGNICRSPMAEYLCRNMAAARGLPVHTASAGTSGWHDGEGMHCGSLEVLSDEGIDSSGFVSRRVRTQDSTTCWPWTTTTWSNWNNASAATPAKSSDNRPSAR